MKCLAVSVIMLCLFMSCAGVDAYVHNSKTTGYVITIPEDMGFVTIGGYADFECEDFEDTNLTFDQNQLGIILGSELFERLRFYSEYVIKHGGTDAQGSGESEVEQAWFDFLIGKKVNFRAGFLIVPFGRYNLYNNPDVNDLTSSPLMAHAVIPSTWAESGAGIWGDFGSGNKTRELYFGYEAYLVNGLDADFSDTGLRNARGSVENDSNNPLSFVGRLKLNRGNDQILGLSAYQGKYDLLNNYISGIGLDAFLPIGPVELIAEYARFNVGQTGVGRPEFFKGYYAQVNYHFWFKSLDNSFLGRNFDDPTFTLSGRYGQAHIDDDLDLDAVDNREKRYTAGLNYRPVENWVFKFEYQWNKTDNEPLDRGMLDGFIASIAMGF